MSITVKHTLNFPAGKSNDGQIHSIVWEDCEAMEGQDHTVLVTANRACVSFWDLEQQAVTLQLESSGLVTDGDDMAECMVVKRDPHDQKLIALGLEDKVNIVDLRKRATKSGDMSFTAHID